jgi:hypothetical protein
MATNIPNKTPPPPPPAKPDGTQGTAPKGGPEPSQEELEKTFMDTMVSASSAQSKMKEQMDGIQKKAADKLKEDQKETLDEMDG